MDKSITSRNNKPSFKLESSVSLQDTSQAEPNLQTTSNTPSQQSTPKADFIAKTRHLETKLDEIIQENRSLSREFQMAKDLRENRHNEMKRILALKES